MIKSYIDSFLYGMSASLDFFGHDSIDRAQRLVAPGGLMRDGEALAKDCSHAFAALDIPHAPRIAP